MDVAVSGLCVEREAGVVAMTPSPRDRLISILEDRGVLHVQVDRVLGDMDEAGLAVVGTSDGAARDRAIAALTSEEPADWRFAPWALEMLETAVLAIEDKAVLERLRLAERVAEIAIMFSVSKLEAGLHKRGSCLQCDELWGAISGYRAAKEGSTALPSVLDDNKRLRDEMERLYTELRDAWISRDEGDKRVVLMADEVERLRLEVARVKGILLAVQDALGASAINVVDRARQTKARLAKLEAVAEAARDEIRPCYGGAGLGIERRLRLIDALAKLDEGAKDDCHCGFPHGSEDEGAK